MRKEKSVSAMLNQYCKEIVEEVGHWKYIKLHGCRDPFWADGCNMNLTRNHILYYKSQIRSLCEENHLDLPTEYYIPTPPEVDDHYMAKNLDFPERIKSVFQNAQEKPTRISPEYDSDKLTLF